MAIREPIELGKTVADGRVVSSNAWGYVEGRGFDIYAPLHSKEGYLGGYFRLRLTRRKLEQLLRALTKEG